MSSAEGSFGAEKPVPMKVRALLVDERVKEFTLGPAHDVTDRLLVVRRAFRLNDSLPQESTSTPHWLWQRGGWLLVDRVTGHIAAINLPQFDPVYSAVSWYRDYAAYCGVSDDGEKKYAVVSQISRRKPILKKLIEKPKTSEADPDQSGKKRSEPSDASADSACPPPAWQRNPTRVIFEPALSPKQTFGIRGHVVDLITEDGEPDDEEASR